MSKYVLLSYWSIDWIEFYALKCREKGKFETCLFFSFDFETFLEFNFLFFYPNSFDVNDLLRKATQKNEKYFYVTKVSKSKLKKRQVSNFPFSQHFSAKNSIQSIDQYESSTYFEIWIDFYALT